MSAPVRSCSTFSSRLDGADVGAIWLHRMRPTHTDAISLQAEVASIGKSFPAVLADYVGKNLKNGSVRK